MTESAGTRGYGKGGDVAMPGKIVLVGVVVWVVRMYWRGKGRRFEFTEDCSEVRWAGEEDSFFLL